MINVCANRLGPQRWLRLRGLALSAVLAGSCMAAAACGTARSDSSSTLPTASPAQPSTQTASRPRKPGQTEAANVDAMLGKWRPPDECTSFPHIAARGVGGTSGQKVALVEFLQNGTMIAGSTVYTYTIIDDDRIQVSAAGSSTLVMEISSNGTDMQLSTEQSVCSLEKIG
jgi:hypothetical protein